MHDTLIAFDLDDTLYKERDFVFSGYSAVAKTIINENKCFDYELLMDIMLNAPGNAFDSLNEYLSNRATELSIANKISIPEMVACYRNHYPDITADDASTLLQYLITNGYRVAIITDGRSITQSNKIKALGFDLLVDPRNISISELIGAEKYSPVPFERMMKLNPDVSRYIYVGDNPMKDFVWPNRLGWATIQLLDDGRNIHSQSIALPNADYQPKITISSLSEISDILSHMQI